MNRVAQFQKVSLTQFSETMKEEFGFKWTDEELQQMHDKLSLPKRATGGSAGYDFKAPFEFELLPGKTIMIPTGIRCLIDEGWWLGIFPRSSLGWKFKLKLDNTIPVVDSDYSGSDNEGHILLKLTNYSKRSLSINRGDRLCQCILIPYGITVD